jgi:hypothetical protein
LTVIILPVMDFKKDLAAASATKVKGSEAKSLEVGGAQQ